jgi:hypothetical protein
LIGGDGSAYEGRGWKKQGAHTKGIKLKPDKTMADFHSRLQQSKHRNRIHWNLRKGPTISKAD